MDQYIDQAKHSPPKSNIRLLMIDTFKDSLKVYIIPHKMIHSILKFFSLFLIIRYYNSQHKSPIAQKSCSKHNTTYGKLCLKKTHHPVMTILSSNLNQFSKFFHYWKDS